MTPCAADSKCLESHYTAVLDMYAWFDQRVDIHRTLDPGMSTGFVRERSGTLLSAFVFLTFMTAVMLYMDDTSDEGSFHLTFFYVVYSVIAPRN